ncbi:hypothetical protein PVAND_015380 [Polypedilum vanderplanki]|uniref:Gustatory receptor n=1 Tax=Polypedilum vanderplanki TaxID=319348 RepID=A0A9J6BCM7_POLVA|nr:hypothetical protein PVAND_015380 [Polypedilum vanderplanki]
MQPLLGAIVAFINRRKFLRLIQKFELVDLKLKYFKITRNYSTDLKFSIIVLGIFVFIGFGLIILTSSQFFIHNIYHHSIPYENPFFLVGLPFSSLFEYTHGVAMIAIYVRLKSLLKFIKNENNLNINDLKLINFIYTNLTDIMKLSNQIFSLNSLIGLTEFSIHTTFAAFSAYQFFISKIKFDLLIFLLVGVSYFISKIQLYLFLIIYISSVRSTGNDLWIEINKKQNFDQKEKKFREIVIGQMRCNELIASCGVYEFDWIVFFAIMTGAFSYLVVMIQFDLGINKN